MEKLALAHHQLGLRGSLSDASTYRFHEKFKGYAVRLVWLLVEVEAVYGRVTFLCVTLLFRHYFRVKRGKFRKRCDLVIRIELFVYFTTVRFIYPDICQSFVIKVGFFLKAG